MELTELRSELRRLTAIVEGWNAPEEITGIERDLALAKLRTLYEALRFDGVTADAEAASAGDASDFAAALELEPFSLDPDEPFVGAFSGETAPVETEPVGEGPEVEVELIFAEDAFGEEPTKPESELAERSAEEPSEADGAAAEPQPECFGHEMPVASDPEPSEECAPAPAAGAMPEADVTEPADAAAAPEPEAKDLGQTGAAMPEPETKEFELRDAAIPEPEAKEPEPEPQPATPVGAPTLFGTEEATKRHRHRQRVIMSLYDADPAPVRSEPAAAAAEPEAARLRTDTTEIGSATTEEGPVSALERLAAVQGVSAPQPAPVETQPEADSDPVVESPAERAEATEQTAVGPNFVGTGTVLGDVINHDVRTLGETIAPPRGEASELARTEPVTDLRRAIGINDKFLLLRDLFGGDETAYGRAIDALNGMESLDDCMIWIAEHYAWNAGCDGAKFLMELLERKYA